MTGHPEPALPNGAISEGELLPLLEAIGVEGPEAAQALMDQAIAGPDEAWLTFEARGARYQLAWVLAGISPWTWNLRRAP
jgi:hypothetical protein